MWLPEPLKISLPHGHRGTHVHALCFTVNGGGVGEPLLERRRRRIKRSRVAPRTLAALLELSECHVFSDWDQVEGGLVAVKG